MEMEKRTFNCEVRAEGEGEGVKIIGYAAVFNERSENLGGFREIIAPGAFDDVLGDDCRGLFNHDRNIVLGRNGTTMRLSVDERGLKYEIDAPDTQLVRDMVIAPMKRGDVNQSSFAFRIAPNGDKWEEDEEGIIIRTVTKVSRLADVSPVTYPAYTASSSTARSLDEFKRSQDDSANDEAEKAKNAKWRAYVERELSTL